MAGSAQAAPVTYTYHADNAGGTINGASFGPGTTYDVIITADTTAITGAAIAGGSATCAPSITAAVSIAGGAVGTIGTPLFVCIRDSGARLGIYAYDGASYTNFIYTNPVLAGGSAVLTTLTSRSIPTSGIVSTGNSSMVSLTAGGTFVPTAPNANNSTASFFSVANTPAPVPTLSEWAMILFGAILAGGAALYIQRRRFTI